MGIVIKEVHPDELEGYVSQHRFITPIIWAGIFEDDELKGHGCCSLMGGKAWAHDLHHWGSSPMSVARLYDFMERTAYERGVTEIYTDVSDQRMADMYRKKGWQLYSVVLKGTLGEKQK